MASRFLVLHGLGGSGPDHWQSRLADRLRARGHDVAYPDLPDPDAPTLEGWLATLAAQRRGGEVVLCHSLSCLLWLHHRRTGGAPAERVLLVAPPCADAGVPEIAPFFPAPLEPAFAHGARLVCSDNDPYCRVGAASFYGEPLAIPVDLLPGAGHVNVDAGYGPWAEVEQWALGEADALA